MFKLGFGFKKKRVEACLGEEIPLELDESLFKDNVKRAKKFTKKNSFARWSKEDGSKITDSKTIQDDDGTTYTRSNQTSYLMHQIENIGTRENDDAIYECITSKNGGNPQFIWGKRKIQNWIAYLKKSNNSFCINGQNLENPNQSGEYFRINREGNNFQPKQWCAFAVLKEDTGEIQTNTTYFLGQGTPLNIIVNEGGLLYPGAGNDPSRPATFRCKEGAKYLAYISVSIKFANDEKIGEIQGAIRIISGSEQRTTSGINAYPIGIFRNSATALAGVDAKKGDIIRFLAYCTSPGTTWKIERTLGATYTTYIGVYCLG